MVVSARPAAARARRPGCGGEQGPQVGMLGAQARGECAVTARFEQGPARALPRQSGRQSAACSAQLGRRAAGEQMPAEPRAAWCSRDSRTDGVAFIAAPSVGPLRCILNASLRVNRNESITATMQPAIRPAHLHDEHRPVTTDYALRLLMYLGTCTERRDHQGSGGTLRHPAQPPDEGGHRAEGFCRRRARQGRRTWRVRRRRRSVSATWSAGWSPASGWSSASDPGSHCLLDPACRLQGRTGRRPAGLLCRPDRLTLADLIGDDGPTARRARHPQADAPAPGRRSRSGRAPGQTGRVGTGTATQGSGFRVAHAQLALEQLAGGVARHVPLRRTPLGHLEGRQPGMHV